MSDTLQGILLQSVGGLCEVETADAVYTCKMRGVFRQRGEMPIAGDKVEITLQPDGTGMIETILPRKNALVRPPLANIDCLVIVVSVKDPEPNLQIINTMIAIAERREIEPVIVINKTDLSDGDALSAIYANAGFKVFTVSVTSPDTIASLKTYLRGKVSAFTGNSGVGKSSILNVLQPSLSLATGDISQKLGRGRHTTRTVTLFHVGDGLVADTAGFSSLDIAMVENELSSENLFFCFREFEKHFGHCRFSSCTHTKELNCAIRAAVDAGEIAASRYETYLLLFSQLKNKKNWN